jgi:O-antigen ligase
MIAIIPQLIHDRFQLRFNKSFLALLIFALYTFLSGVFVAQDFEELFSTLLSFIECLGVFYLIVCYVLSDGKPDFPMIVFIVHAFLIAYFVVFRGVGKWRIGISEALNVNTIGVSLAFSIGFILYLLIQKKNKPIKWIIGLVAIATMLVGIMLTASKKAIICSAVLIILWIILCYRFTFAKIPLALRFAVFAGIIVAGILVYRWYTSTYAQQVEYMINRMSGLYVGESDQARIEMIKEGFWVFLSHPFFGVGFNNARFYISYAAYTHCLYAEVLACTGVIGAILFGYAIIRPWMNIVRARKTIKTRDSFQNTRVVFLLTIFFMFLLINLTQIAFYEQNLMFIYSVCTAFATQLSMSNKKFVANNEMDRSFAAIPLTN